MIHPGGDNFETVGNDLAGNKTIAHSLMAHHDAIGDGRSPEDLRNTSCRPDALTTLASKAVQMRVAGSDVAEQGGHTDHRPSEIFVEKANGAEHRTIRCPAHALCRELALELDPSCHDCFPQLKLSHWTSYQSARECFCR